MCQKVVLSSLRLSMDKIYLIGHRGVGKTRMVKAMKAIQSRFTCVDLDEEIELRTGQKVFNIIMSKGLKFFRQLEFEVLKSIESAFEGHKKKKYIVALGAGFNIDTYIQKYGQKSGFPKNSFLLWLRRTTDPMGRIFFDRPSLTLGASKNLNFLESENSCSRFTSEASLESSLLPDPLLPDPSSP